MAVTENLVQGAARIYVAAVGATLPVPADLEDLATGVLEGWTSVGHTTTGVTLRDEPETVEATSQQAGRKLDVAVQSWTTTIESAAREATLANLANLTHSSVDTGTVSAGSNGATPKFSVAIVGPWGDGGTCLIVAERCVFTSGLTLEFSSASFIELPFTIEVLEGSTLPNAYKVYAA